MDREKQQRDENEDRIDGQPRMKLPNDEAKGLGCKRCGCVHRYVLRTVRMDGRIRRQCECRHCGNIYNTYEHLPGE